MVTSELKEFHPALRDFILNVREITKQYEDEKTVTAKVAEQLKLILTVPNLLPDEYYDYEANRTRNFKVYVEPDKSFSIACSNFPLGRGTPIHDHQAWGVIGVIEGMEIQTDYYPPEKEEELLEVKGVHLLRSGEVRVCCTFDQDLHDVRSGFVDKMCVALHVYGGDLGCLERNSYDPLTGEKTPFVMPWETP